MEHAFSLMSDTNGYYCQKKDYSIKKTSLFDAVFFGRRATERLLKGKLLAGYAWESDYIEISQKNDSFYIRRYLDGRMLDRVYDSFGDFQNDFFVLFGDFNPADPPFVALSWIDKIPCRKLLEKILKGIISLSLVAVLVLVVFEKQILWVTPAKVWRLAWCVLLFIWISSSILDKKMEIRGGVGFNYKDNPQEFFVCLGVSVLLLIVSCYDCVRVFIPPA